VVQAAGVAEGDHAGGVDPVAAHPVWVSGGDGPVLVLLRG
jgi:hypothetical protein